MLLLSIVIFHRRHCNFVFECPQAQRLHLSTKRTDTACFSGQDNVFFLEIMSNKNVLRDNYKRAKHL